jgi:hypothetical protein
MEDYLIREHRKYLREADEKKKLKRDNLLPFYQQLPPELDRALQSNEIVARWLTCTRLSAEGIR